MSFKMDSDRAKELAAKHANVSLEIRPHKSEGFAIFTVESGHACDLARLMVEAGEPDFLSGLRGPLWAVIAGHETKGSSINLDTQWDGRFKIGYALPSP